MARLCTNFGDVTQEAIGDGVWTVRKRRVPRYGTPELFMRVMQKGTFELFLNLDLIIERKDVLPLGGTEIDIEFVAEMDLIILQYLLEHLRSRTCTTSEYYSDEVA